MFGISSCRSLKSNGRDYHRLATNSAVKLAGTSQSWWGPLNEFLRFSLSLRRPFVLCRLSSFSYFNWRIGDKVTQIVLWKSNDRSFQVQHGLHVQQTKTFWGQPSSPLVSDSVNTTFIENNVTAASFSHVLFQSYSVVIGVDKITPIIIGREIAKRCGNEGQWQYLNAKDKATLEFLQAASTGVGIAIEDRADLTNASFIISQPGREFVLKAGKGDWEYHFSMEGCRIVGRCIRKPLPQYLWDGLKGVVSRVVPALVGSVTKALSWY